MAELNPPYALQNAGATHTAEGDRMMLSGLFAGIRAAASLVGRGGVHPMAGGLLAVTQTGSPSMSLQIASGVCYVSGTEGTKQGLYACTNDATDTVAVTTAHATLPRIDSVIARVYDSAYSGAANNWALEILTGTAASSPLAPTLPANAIRLYNVQVGAAVTSISNGNLTDVRTYVTSVGGVIPVKDNTERDALLNLVPNGQGVFVLSTGNLEFKLSGAFVPRSSQRPLISNQVSSPTFSTGGAFVDFTTPQWPAITFTAPPSGIFTVTIGAGLSNVASSTASILISPRISGGLVSGSDRAKTVWATGSTFDASRSFTYTGATPGASVTVTPQWQVTTGTGASASCVLGQLKVVLEP